MYIDKLKLLEAVKVMTHCSPYNPSEGGLAENGMTKMLLKLPGSKAYREHEVQAP